MPMAHTPPESPDAIIELGLGLLTPPMSQPFVKPLPQRRPHASDRRRSMVFDRRLAPVPEHSASDTIIGGGTFSRRASEVLSVASQAIGSDVRRTMNSPRRTIVALAVVLSVACFLIASFRYLAHLYVSEPAPHRAYSRYHRPASDHVRIGSDIPVLHFVGSGAHGDRRAVDERPTARRPLRMLPPDSPPLQRAVEFGRAPALSFDRPVRSGSMRDAAGEADRDLLAAGPPGIALSESTKPIEPEYRQLFDGSTDALDPVYAAVAEDTPEREARAQAREDAAAAKLVALPPLPMRRVKALPGALKL